MLKIFICPQKQLTTNHKCNKMRSVVHRAGWLTGNRFNVKGSSCDWTIFILASMMTATLHLVLAGLYSPLLNNKMQYTSSSCFLCCNLRIRADTGRTCEHHT